MRSTKYIQDNSGQIVEKILSKKIHNNKSYYLVKWLDLEEGYSSWEPFEKIRAFREIVRDYELQNHNATEIELEKILRSPKHQNLEKSNKHVRKSSRKSNREVFNNNVDDPIELDSTGMLLENDSNQETDSNNKTIITKFSNSSYNKFTGEKRKRSNQTKNNNNNIALQELLITDNKIKELSNNIYYEVHEADLENDIPSNIKAIQSIDSELYVIIEWEQRSCGEIPPSKHIEYNIIRERYPDLLINFYENRLLSNNLRISTIK